ncbi:MAG: gamma carbonic anhydrase family protein [Lachnospiraceae bacterium]|nr:gamma carbonic anhydrase family protein [Lachnospiraceae bacterium]
MDKKEKKIPQIHPTVYLAEGAIVEGNVSIDAESSVFYHAVVRAGNAQIRIGKQTNIQDNCVLHVDYGEKMEIGDGVTIGHGAIVHCREVGDNSLIGMGAILLNGAVIGKNCIVGAGTLVTKNTIIPAGSLVLGQPGKAVRELTGGEIDANRRNALHYVQEAEEALAHA